jgi:hypothetical protein
MQATTAAPTAPAPGRRLLGAKDAARTLLVGRHYRIARIWSNRELARLAPLFTGDVVNVSGWEDRDKEGRVYRDYFTAASSYSVTNYGGVRGHTGRDGELFLDLTAPMPDELQGRFDVAYNHTTLEHVFDVRQAFRTLCDLSRDIVIVVVPFSQAQHESESYGDYWRVSPGGLRAMFAENGMEVVYESCSPYRNAAIYLLFVGARDPERWRGVLPPYEPLTRVGARIGSRYLGSVVKPVVRLAKALVRPRTSPADPRTPARSASGPS